MQFESSDVKSDTKDDRTKNTNIKEAVNDGSGQVSEPDVETVNIPGDDAPQGFGSYIDEKDVTSGLFDRSALPEGMSIYYISPEETNFFLKKVKNVVIEIKI